jgi:nondiscriminating glutamyl-tRNA synthetase
MILDDLRWLGLDWDEGPGVGGEFGPYRQSERGGIYREHAERLLAEGKAFTCYCSDERLEKNRKRARDEGTVPQYDGTCRHLSESERRAYERDGIRPTIRLRAPEANIIVEDMIRGRVEFGKEMLGDFIILRSDGRPTYNFAVVVDDALMKITHVIRAEDHLPNTMRQQFLYSRLGYELPLFAHVSLIVAQDRSKLSKRRAATSVHELRRAGFLPSAVTNYLALLGWSHPEAKEILSREELVGAFNLKRVSASAAAFDDDKLEWVNGHHLRESPLSVVVAAAKPFAGSAGFDPDDARFPAIVDLVRDGLDRLSNLPEEIAPFYDREFDLEPEAEEWVSQHESRELLGALADSLAAARGKLDAAEFKAALKSQGSGLGLKGKGLFMPTRAALTGRTHGPALGSTAELLGRKRVISRCRAAAGNVEKQ